MFSDLILFDNKRRFFFSAGKSCGKPEIPEGATIKGNSYSFQDTIEVTCTSSSTPESLIKDFIVCQSDGTWSKLSRCK